MPNLLSKDTESLNKLITAKESTKNYPTQKAPGALHRWLCCIFKEQIISKLFKLFLYVEKERNLPNSLSGARIILILNVTKAVGKKMPINLTYKYW